MNWSAIGAVGESLDAIAVLVSLIYLARQIRQNTRTAVPSGVLIRRRHAAFFGLARR